jgi:uracil-DNA glycosylase
VNTSVTPSVEVMVDSLRVENYRRLVTRRKQCGQRDGLANASVIRNGSLDAEEIGPWTRWLGDLNARVLVVGQDWGDQKAFERQGGLDLPTSATNPMLRRLLASIGVDVPDVGVAAAPAGVFLTNAALCLKEQGCQGPVRYEWFETCGQSFLGPQIDLVQPKVVVCLGERAYRAVVSAYQLTAADSFRGSVEGPGVTLPNGSIMFAVYHCGRRILNTHRNADAQFRDWRRIAMALRTNHEGSHRMPKRTSGVHEAEVAVFSRHHERHLEEACKVESASPVLRSFRSRGRWVTAARLVSRQGPIPIYYAVTDGSPVVRYAAELVEVHLDPDFSDDRTKRLLQLRGSTTANERWDDDGVETIYVIRGCRHLHAPFQQSELVKFNGGRPIEVNYTRTYALVRRRHAV